MPVERFISSGHAPLTVVTGPPGASLVAALSTVDDTGVRVVHVHCHESATEFDFPAQLPPLAVLRAAPGTLLVLKDLHRLPPEALGVLEALVRQLAHTRTRCVGGLALPLPAQARPAFAASFARLREEGLVRHTNLRPVLRRELPELVASRIGALPEPALLDRLWSLTRGWPDAVAAALRIGEDNGSVTVVDRHAYLTGRRRVRDTGHSPLLADIRRLGPPAWQAAKAVAAFAPLGPALPRLVGQALEVAEGTAEELLDQLVRAGVLRHVAGGPAWRFRLPLLGLLLQSAFGPYERCRLAQLAVTALWQGTAHCADPAYLPDQLVHAGTLVDPERARRELLAAGHAAAGDAEGAPRWLRAAAELTADRAQRVEILLARARICLGHGDARRALESTDTVLCRYAEEVPAEALLDLCFSHLASLHGSGDTTVLAEVARGTWWPWPGTRLERASGRAFALWLLGRWRETQDLLAEIRRDPDAGLVEAHLRTISPVTGLWLGEATEFDREVAGLPARIKAGERPHGQLRSHLGALLALGELSRAEALLTLADRVPVRPAPASQAVRAALAGRVDEALELTRKAVATGSGKACDAEQSAMFHLAATLQLCRGNLARGLELVDTARRGEPALPHLLAAVEAAHELVFRNDGTAQSILAAALAEAEAAGVVAGTELLWAALADIAVNRGRLDLLPHYLARVGAVAERMGTEQAEVSRLTLHAVVHADRAAATEACLLLRRRGQPLALAVGLARLVRYRVGRPELLSEAYAAAGEMDTLLQRAWLRNEMRANGIAVPGRQATVAENERLLAVLVADGLGNKQIGALLDTSEKSVEGRLSRLFSRNSYRSRVELATAMLTGRFRP